MTAIETAILIQAMASNARIEAMKVANQHAQANGHREPVFPFAAFQDEAKELRALSDNLRSIATP